MKLFCLLVSVLVSYFLFVPNAVATVRHVPSGYSHIQNAVNASQDGDTILVATGLYREQVIIGQVRLTVAGEFLFSHDTTDRDSTIITIPDSIRNSTGDRKSVLIIHNSPSIIITGVTLRDGLGNGVNPFRTQYGILGGNLFADSSSIQLKNCRLAHGTAWGGGAMAMFTGALQITNCVFDSNSGLSSSGWMGGAINVDVDSLHINNSVFSHNYHLVMAGAAEINTNWGILDSNLFIENTSEYDAGALYTYGVSIFRSNQFVGNRSRQHAGFILSRNYDRNLSGVFTNNIVTNNVKFDTARSFSNTVGGGFCFYSLADTWLIADNVFDGNINQGLGSGALDVQSGTFEFRRNFFLNNTGGNVSSAIQVLQPAHVTLDSNIFFNNNRGMAIYNMMGTVTAHHNDFYGNVSGAMRYGDTGVWFADSNWWGDASGPTAVNNPNGTGDSVDYRIPYTPWLTSPVFPTAVREHNKEIANTFHLLQVYPNPFNNTTTIRYTLPRRTSVKVMLCDLTGREVDTLFRGILNAGTHSTSFDGSRFASGTYFVRLYADNRIQTKKIVLLK